MERRKITALGKYSLVISLPKDWIKMNNLSRGEMVSLAVQKDGALIVHPSLDVSEKEREITLSVGAEDDGNSIIRRIIGCYLNGYDTIHLTSGKIFTVEQQTAIRNVVRSLYMRILESTASRVILQTLMDESMASILSGIERMHIITSSMCQDVRKSMEEWDEELARSVVSLEEDVDQFMYFLLRLTRMAATNPSLANQLDLDMMDCLDYQFLVNKIEHVADHITSIADSLIFLFEKQIYLPKDIFPVLIKSAGIAFDAYDQAVQSFLSKNVDNVNEVIDQQKEIERLEETIKPLPYYGERDERTTVCHICYIRDNINRISEYAADIAELTIDRTYKM